MNYSAHQNRMIEKYKPYIASLARKLGRQIRFSHLGMEQEDLEQAGYLALLEMLSKIDWKKNNTRQIDNYIRRVLFGRMVDAVRTADPNYRNYKKTNGKLYFCSLEELSSPKETDPGTEPTVWIDILMFLNSLPHRERWIMLYSLQGFTRREVATLLASEGCRQYTPIRISQLSKQALAPARRV